MNQNNTNQPYVCIVRAITYLIAQVNKITAEISTRKISIIKRSSNKYSDFLRIVWNSYLISVVVGGWGCTPEAFGRAPMWTRSSTPRIHIVIGVPLSGGERRLAIVRHLVQSSSSKSLGNSTKSSRAPL